MEAGIPTIIGYIWQIVDGSLMTIYLAVSSLILSTIFGIGLACALFSKNKLAKNSSLFYTMVSKGFPDLLLIFIIFYGGQMLLNEIGAKIGLNYIEISPFFSGVVSITIIFTSYMAETFKGAYLSIPYGQIEAALAFGLSKKRILFKIIAPQIIKYALPGYTNNWLVLLKTTAIVSVVGLDDMLRRATIASGATHNPTLFYGIVGVIYLIFTFGSSKFFLFLQRRYFNF